MERTAMSIKEIGRGVVLARLDAGTMGLDGAAQLLGIDYRQMKRLARRYRGGGAAALVHGTAACSYTPVFPATRARPPSTSATTTARPSASTVATPRTSCSWWTAESGCAPGPMRSFAARRISPSSSTTRTTTRIPTSWMRPPVTSFSGLRTTGTSANRRIDAPSEIAEVIAREASRGRSALQAAAGEPSLERALRVGMLNKVSALGFTRPPAPLPHRTLPNEQVVRGDAQYPILWMRDADDEIVCSANGHAFTVAASLRVLAPDCGAERQRSASRGRSHGRVLRHRRSGGSGV